MPKRPCVIDPRGELTLGQIVVTPGALAAIERAGDYVECYTAAQSAGDWGDSSDEDWDANNRAVVSGGRILAVHRTHLGDTIWVITEADRSVTSVLLPEEY